MKAVMYHYVREYDPTHPNFRFLDINNFRKQLDYFHHNFGFVTRQEWLDFISSGQLPQVSGKVVLTFDDALSCHYNYVLPELLTRGLWGIFYIPVQPYLDGRILDVHRIHQLCGALNGDDLLRVLMSMINDDMIPDRKIQEFRKLTYKHQTNLSGVSEFKRILNYFINYKHVSQVIDNISIHFGYQFKPQDIYVPYDKLSHLKDNGMFIGSHTVTHPVMSKLNAADQRLEIDKSFDFLEAFFEKDQKTYCHPYGGFHSFDQNTIQALKENNVVYAFNVDPREISSEDHSKSKYFLPRFDCNLFPHGTAS